MANQVSSSRAWRKRLVGVTVCVIALAAIFSTSCLSKPGVGNLMPGATQTQGIIPKLLSPPSDSSCRNPVTFRWVGSSAPGETYQLFLRYMSTDGPVDLLPTMPMTHTSFAYTVPNKVTVADTI